MTPIARSHSKADAGFRTVALPSALVAVVREHLAEFPRAIRRTLIFNGPKGATLRARIGHGIWRDRLRQSLVRREVTSDKALR
jgi:hypothetical protein